MTIAAMILVSTPGTWNAVYAPLDHAAWNGWTPTDLVFPFLLFAMGAAVPFALARRRAAAARTSVHVIRRAAILFALGLLLNAIELPPPLRWATFRIPGVLQRIAVVYVAVAWLTERVSFRGQVAFAIAALGGYWAAMLLIPVPGIGAGILTPARQPRVVSRSRAASGSHMLNQVWDPEGLLSTIPAIVTALGGVFAGDWLSEAGPHRTLWLWLAGLTAMLAGLMWGRVFPSEQEPLDQFLRALHRGFRRATAGAAALGGGRAAVAQHGRSRSPRSDAIRSPRISCRSAWTACSRAGPTGQGASLKSVIYRGTFVAWLRPTLQRRNRVARLRPRLRRAVGRRAQRAAPAAHGSSASEGIIAVHGSRLPRCARRGATPRLVPRSHRHSVEGRSPAVTSAGCSTGSTSRS